VVQQDDGAIKMELLQWQDGYATGIPGIDYEHEELIAEINRFYSKLESDSDRASLIDVLNDIYGAIYSHFALEEKLMEKYGYDAYEVHRTDHAKLLDELRDITSGLEKSHEYDEQELKKRLSDWFAVHFRTHDARLHKLQDLKASHEKRGSGLFSFFRKSKD
jgi:hemerythrin